MRTHSRIALVVACALGLPALAIAQTITLHGADDCGSISAGQTVTLPPGDHYVEWTAGAYSLWSSDGQNGGNTWIAVAQVFRHAEGDTITIGSPGTFYPTQAAAEAAALGSYPLTVTSPGDITFWLSDGGGCGDNRGTITLNVLMPVPVSPASWGRVKAVYRR
jgi:hypothetical protein